MTERVCRLKPCKRCRRMLHATEENFRRRASSQGGLMHLCKVCAAADDAIRVAKRKAGGKDDLPGERKRYGIQETEVRPGHRVVSFGDAWSPGPRSPRVIPAFGHSSLLIES